MDHSRIIRGAVGGGRYTVTAPITQWDYGYLFLPEIEDLPTTYRLDFSNDEHHGNAYAVYGNSEGAEVPEELIDTGKDIFVWYFYIGDGYGKTEYKWRIPNKCKPKGDGETPEPSQQSSIDQLIYVANEAIDTAHESASQASASAQSASQSAEQAQESARTAGLYSDTAQTYANSAEISANSASASASASAQSAEQSAINSADAQDSAEEAQSYASASAQSATASANSASQASSSATSASQSATSAQGYASQAQTSAQTASSKASEAGTSASTASTKASESAQSASQAQGYAQTAEQAKTASQTAQGLAESARDDAIDAKTDAESARDEAQNIVDEISAKAEQIDQNTTGIASLEDDIYKPYAVDSASGSIASFPDGADDIPLKSLVVNIDPVQSGSGDPSPDNVRPISGWTGMQVHRSGKNLWNGTLINGDVDIDVKVGVTYTVSAIASSAAFLYLRRKPVGASNYARVGYVIAGTTNGSFTFVPEGGYIYSLWSNITYTAIEDVQIEVDSTPTSYEPYQGRTILINWQTEAGTVYGGKLDVLSGVLTVDKAMVDLGTLNWGLASNQFYANIVGAKLGEYSIKSQALCSVYPTLSWSAFLTSGTDKAFAINTRQPRVNVKDSTYTDATTFKTAMNGVQLCYELAEPIEIQLSANQINSLYGTNNIFADTGDTACEYRADTELWVQRKITEAVAAVLNS